MLNHSNILLYNITDSIKHRYYTQNSGTKENMKSIEKKYNKYK